MSLVREVGEPGARAITFMSREDSPPRFIDRAPLDRCGFHLRDESRERVDFESDGLHRMSRVNGGFNEDGSAARKRVEQSPALDCDAADAQKEQGYIGRETGWIPVNAMGEAVAASRPVNAVLSEVEIDRPSLTGEALAQTVELRGCLGGDLGGRELQLRCRARSRCATHHTVQSRASAGTRKALPAPDRIATAFPQVRERRLGTDRAALPEW